MDRLEHLQEKAAARIGQLVPKDWKVDRLVVEHYSDSQAVLHYRLTSQRPNDLEGQTIRLSETVGRASFGHASNHTDVIDARPFADRASPYL